MIFSLQSLQLNVQGWHDEMIETSPLLKQKIVRNEHTSILSALFIRSLPKYRHRVKRQQTDVFPINDELNIGTYAIILPKKFRVVKTNLQVRTTEPEYL